MSTQMSTHALQRVDERLVGDEAAIVNEAIREACAIHGSKSIGIIAHRLSEQRNQAWGNTSNGDCVVVIVRNGQVKTTYLRRATQSFNLSMSRTEILVDMTKTLFASPMMA